MVQIQSLHPSHTTKDQILKIAILKILMYSGVVWGLFHQGWAMMTDQNDKIFPFWLNKVQAEQYAKQYWPNYSAQKISPQDFEQSLFPTLKRLDVYPTLFGVNAKRFKLTEQMMSYFFFNRQTELCVI